MQCEVKDPVREERVNTIVAEYLMQVETGHAPAENEFLRRYPEFAAELEQFLAANRLVDEMVESFETRPIFSTLAWAAGTGLPDEPTASLSAGSAEGEVPELRPEGRRFANYRLLQRIGRGGMGIVYLAEQSHPLRCPVALKKLPERHFGFTPEQVERFRKGAEAGCHLQHPNIVRILQVGEYEGKPFFTMDYIAGKSLADMVREGPLPAKQAAWYMKKVAEAIDYSHEQNTYHRDVKPANVLVEERTGEPKVTDFGLAKRVDTDPHVTSHGVFEGTACYVSPEQAAGKWSPELGVASDVYSLGATLYHLVTGRPPFLGNLTLTLLQAQRGDPVSPRAWNSKVPRDLEAVILKCLRKDCTERYSSAAKLAKDLGRFLEGEPVEARPRALLVRGLYWFRGIPLAARLCGRAFHEPTPGQRRTQCAINFSALAAILLFAAVCLWRALFPAPIAFATGLQIAGYHYYEIMDWVAPRLEARLDRKVVLLPTGGSNENVQLLCTGKADLGPMHLGSGSFDERIRIVTPLYYGTIYVLVREKSGIEEMDQLRGKRISLGPPTLGMRDAAIAVLHAHGINEKELKETDRPFDSLEQDETMDGAIMTLSSDPSELKQAIPQGFKVLSLDPIKVKDLLDKKHQRFRPRSIPLDHQEITTVEAPIVLAARADAPGWLVQKLLESFYDAPVDGRPKWLMSREHAREWVTNSPLAIHPAAKEFFAKAP